MFRRRLNDLRVDITIRPSGPSPLLIKQAEPANENGRRATGGDHNNHFFFLTQRKVDGTAAPYIPGSSLRGVIRTHLTRVVSRWNPAWSVLSDPYENAAAKWLDGQRKDGEHPTGAEIYAVAGPIERCLGMTGLKGRWQIEDAPISGKCHRTVRPGLGIDRHTGAAREGALFFAHAIDDGAFSTTITLVNYEIWQLGLLAHALAALDGGDIRIGYGTHRGFGKVRVHVTGMRFRWYAQASAPAPREGLLPIPPLAALAATTGIDGAYGWRDAEQTLALPLQRNPAAPIGIEWTLAATSATETDWMASPWAEMGPRAGEALAGWEPSGVLGQAAPAGREGAA
jgi:CRISPR/Cas system CSM-associated protein Csm3 (group 7 of RAMP superfamily)